MWFERSNLDTAGFDLHLIAIQRTRGGSTEDLAVGGKLRGVARTYKGVVALLPVVGAA
jgi:hypothetical protein